jgi:hypothetical protein
MISDFMLMLALRRLFLNDPRMISGDVIYILLLSDLTLHVSPNTFMLMNIVLDNAMNEVFLKYPIFVVCRADVE